MNLKMMKNVGGDGSGINQAENVIVWEGRVNMKKIVLHLNRVQQLITINDEMATD